MLTAAIKPDQILFYLLGFKSPPFKRPGQLPYGRVAQKILNVVIRDLGGVSNFKGLPEAFFF